MHNLIKILHRLIKCYVDLKLMINHQNAQQNSKSRKRLSKEAVAFYRQLRWWSFWNRITSPFRLVGKFLSHIITVYGIAFLLIVIAFFLWIYYRLAFDALISNIVTDLLGAAIAILVIDTTYRLRSDKEQKKVLISKLGSHNNVVATEALHELNAKGWLSDGSVQGAFLLSSNLDGNSFTGADLRRVIFSFSSLRSTTWFEADLRGASLDHTDLSDATLSMHAVGPHYTEADLTGASLTNTNLTRAKIRSEQLCRASSLHDATMPDGELYDGRFNLVGDIDLFFKLKRDPNDPKAWASFYRVSVDQYLNGQSWAEENLDRLF